MSLKREGGTRWEVGEGVIELAGQIDRGDGLRAPEGQGPVLIRFSDATRGPKKYLSALHEWRNLVTQEPPKTLEIALAYGIPVTFRNRNKPFPSAGIRALLQGRRITPVVRASAPVCS